MANEFKDLTINDLTGTTTAAGRPDDDERIRALIHETATKFNQLLIRLDQSRELARKDHEDDLEV